MLNDKLKIIVVGGLSAGPSAAAKARRENEQAQIILFEKGENISYATCGIPYALSGVIENRDKLLVVEAQLLQQRFNIDVKLEEEVIKINVQNKVVYTTKGEYTYDKLMFATGARSIVPPIRNIELVDNWSTCRSLKDFDKIINEGVVNTVKNIAVIGAGLIGVEIAENLVKAGKNVTLIEAGSKVLPMWTCKFASMAEQVMLDKGVKIIKSTFVKEFNVASGKVKSLDVGTNENILTDYVIMSTGIKPNTKLLIDNGAEHLANGALLVNDKMETSIKDVYAAGDNVAIKNLQTNSYNYFPLGTHSNKGGRAAGANMVGGNIKFKGAYKTAIIKVFDYVLARTGMSLEILKEEKINYKSILILSGASPSYYPDAKDLIIEIYFDADSEKVLGAELFGEKGVDKRVDVLSTAIYAGLKIDDLAQLDLAYAPPFSPAKDPVVVASFVADNCNRNLTNQIDVDKLKSYLDVHAVNDYILLDVRTKEENIKGKIPNSVSIPLDDLRSRLDEIKEGDKPIFVYCAKGLRGYLASLILSHNNFNDIYNLAGGFKLWEMSGGLVDFSC